mmetsp:Transcript_11358/g.11317  ORF Transcript_11358/g.11317 Transcript_11358/m.11317 type:complete len:152 (+) Transcript_11358:661-1116(+)
MPEHGFGISAKNSVMFNAKKSALFNDHYAKSIQKYLDRTNDDDEIFQNYEILPETSGLDLKTVEEVDENWGEEDAFENYSSEDSFSVSEEDEENLAESSLAIPNKAPIMHVTEKNNRDKNYYEESKVESLSNDSSEFSGFTPAKKPSLHFP